MFLYTTSSISINNYFSYKMQSKFLSGEKEQNYLKHVNFSSLFFLDSFLNSNFFSGKSTFSSDDIFLLCQVCNNSFDQRTKIISNPFSGIYLFKKAIFLLWNHKSTPNNYNCCTDINWTYSWELKLFRLSAFIFT